MTLKVSDITISNRNFLSLLATGRRRRKATGTDGRVAELDRTGLGCGCPQRIPNPKGDIDQNLDEFPDAAPATLNPPFNRASQGDRWIRHSAFPLFSRFQSHYRPGPVCFCFFHRFRKSV